MSTTNFSCSRNSQYIYAFCSHDDFEAYVDDNKDALDLETEEDVEYAKYEDANLYNDWYDDEKEYYLQWLEEVLNEAVAGKKGLYSNFSESCRIYDGDSVAEVRKYIPFAGGEFMVMASIDFKAGYYEGFSLDWNIAKIEGTSYGDSFDYLPDSDDCHYLLSEETDLNEGLCKALAPKLQARLQTAMDEVTGVIEEALQKVSPYHLTGAVASNGEGFYTNHKGAA